MKKVILSVVVFVLSLTSNAQDIVVSKKMEFGFNFGLSKTNLQLKGATSNLFYYNSIGFDLGVLMDYKFSKFVSISPQIELNHSNAEIHLTNSMYIKEYVYEVMPTNLVFKTHFQINTTLNESSPYIIFGPSLRVDLRRKNNLPTTLLKTKPNVALDLGFGLNNQMKFVNFAPEFIYSFGLSQLSVSPAVSHFYYHRLALVFNFKG